MKKDLLKRYYIKAYAGVAFINDYKEFWKHADLKKKKFITAEGLILLTKCLSIKNLFPKKLIGLMWVIQKVLI